MFLCTIPDTFLKEHELLCRLLERVRLRWSLSLLRLYESQPTLTPAEKMQFQALRKSRSCPNANETKVRESIQCPHHVIKLWDSVMNRNGNLHAITYTFLFVTSVAPVSSLISGSTKSAVYSSSKTSTYASIPFRERKCFPN